MPSKQVCCKVYYALLLLCYLEVVLWTSCLLGSCGATVVTTNDSHCYLLRETDNLKLAGCEQPELPLFFSLRGADWHLHLERQYLQRHLTSLIKAAPRSLNPAWFAVSQPAVLVTGVPAPFAGIQAIS